MKTEAQWRLACGCLVTPRCCSCGGSGELCFPVHYLSGKWRVYDYAFPSPVLSSTCGVDAHHEAWSEGSESVVFILPDPEEWKVLQHAFKDLLNQAEWANVKIMATRETIARHEDYYDQIETDEDYRFADIDPDNPNADNWDVEYDDYDDDDDDDDGRPAEIDALLVAQLVALDPAEIDEEADAGVADAVH